MEDTCRKIWDLSNNSYSGGFSHSFSPPVTVPLLTNKILPLSTKPVLSVLCVPAFFMQQAISVWVRDPRIQKNDFWHAYIDYEICLHTDSVFLTKKTSRVRRRYSEFVWLRQKLQENALLMVQLPELPPKNPFFSLNSAQQITERMKGLQKFLELVLQSRLLLSDSCLHLFLQSDLSVSMIEACAAGRTNYSVAQAVQRSGLRRFHSEDNLPNQISRSCGSDSDSSESRDLEDKIRDLAVNKGSTSSLDLLDSSYKTRTRHSDAYL